MAVNQMHFPINILSPNFTPFYESGTALDKKYQETYKKYKNDLIN